jgi:hypothetical protein
MVSCSIDLEICRNIAESSSTVNLRSSRSAFSIFSTIEGLPLLWLSWTDIRPFLNLQHHLNTQLYHHMQFLPHYKPQLEFFPSKWDNRWHCVFHTWWEIGLAIFTKPIVVSTVLNILTSNLSHRGEESGYMKVYPTCKKIPPAVRVSVHLLSGHTSYVTHLRDPVMATMFSLTFEYHKIRMCASQYDTCST